eukprot:scaffold103160_cov44-Prasinocladus_malaysianus.AAC.1
MAGLRTVGWQYGQRGVVASVCTDKPNSTAWQSFLATGPLALLPVRIGRLILAPYVEERFDLRRS